MLPAGVGFSLAYMDGFRRGGRWGFAPGTTVGQALVQVGVDPQRGAFRAYINDRMLWSQQHPWWCDVLPEPGSIVAVRRVAEIPVWLIWVLLIISLLASIAQLVLTLTQKQEERDTQNRFDSPTLRGARNRIAVHEPIPRLYGAFRTKPPLGAYTYTEIVGSDHYLRCLFIISYGPVAMDTADMRIGETPLSEFTDVEIEIREGTDEDLPITLYPVQVTQEDLNITLYDQKTAIQDVIPGEPPGGTGWQTRVSDLNTDEIGIELMFPEGMANVTGKGENQPNKVVDLIEVRRVGDTTWTRPSQEAMRITALGQHGAAPGEVKIEGQRFGSFTVGINFPVPVRDQYEVRIRHIAGPGLDYEGHNTMYAETRWIALKSFRNEAPWNKRGIAMVAMRIRATDQLQGTIDDFTVLARAKLPTWDGTAWTAPIETRNPAWAYCDVLRGSANPDPIADELIDGNRFKEWAEVIESHTTPDETGEPVLNPMYFDGIFDFRSTVYRTLADIAAVARGTPHMRDGFFSVVYDRDRSAEPPVQMITPRNIVTGSFTARKVFIEEAHAYRISFKNAAKDYGEDEVVLFTAGYNAGTARIYEKIEWLGITDADRAVDETRFMVAARAHRPEIYRFDMDVEHVVFERGDLVLFAHDAPLLGLAYGRVARTQWMPDPHPGVISKIWLDEKVVYQPGVAYGVRIRRHQTVLQVLDSVAVINPATAGGVEVESQEITFVTGIPEPTGPVEGDLVTFGELGVETRRCIVRSITSAGTDLLVTVELEDEGAQIFGDLTEPIPPYDPGINRPADLPPLAPEILSLTSPDHLNLVVTFRLFSGFGRSISRCELEVRVSPDGPWQPVPSVAPAGFVSVTIPGLELDRYYDVRVRAVSPSNVFSPWTVSEPFLLASHPVEISRYAISDLRLENILIDPDQFVGPSPTWRWQIAVSDGTDEGDPLSESLRQASIVRESEIDRFDGYLIRVLEAIWVEDENRYVPGAMIDEALIQDNRFTYTFDHNVDDGGPRRELFFEVAAQIDSQLTQSIFQLATNPSPEVPALVSLSGVNGSSIELTLAPASGDADWEGVLVWMSEESGFVVSNDNLIFKGRLDQMLSIPARTATTYYLRYASFDRFSSDPATLQISDEHSVTTGAIAGVVLQTASIFKAYSETPTQIVLSTLTPPPWIDFGGISSPAYYGPQHQVRFDALFDGVVHIIWHALYTHTYSSAEWRMWIGFLEGSEYVSSAFTKFLANSAILAGASSFVEGSTVSRIECELTVTAGQTYWFDCWLVAGYPPVPHAFNTYMDVFTVEQISEGA